MGGVAAGTSPGVAVDTHSQHTLIQRDIIATQQDIAAANASVLKRGSQVAAEPDLSDSKRLSTATTTTTTTISASALHHDPSIMDAMKILGYDVCNIVKLSRHRCLQILLHHNMIPPVGSSDMIRTIHRQKVNSSIIPSPTSTITTATPPATMSSPHARLPVGPMLIAASHFSDGHGDDLVKHMHELIREINEIDNRIKAYTVEKNSGGHGNFTEFSMNNDLMQLGKRKHDCTQILEHTFRTYVEFVTARQSRRELAERNGDVGPSTIACWNTLDSIRSKNIADFTAAIQHVKRNMS